MYAKANVFKSLVEWSVENAKWLLERLEKETYSKRDMIEQQSTITVRDPLRERLLELKEQKEKAESMKKTAKTSQKKKKKTVKKGKTKAKKIKFKIVK